MGLFDFFKRNKNENVNIKTVQPNSPQNEYYDLFLREYAKTNEYFEHGTVEGRTITTEEINDIVFKARTYHEKYLDTLYDFTSIEGISKIPNDKADVPLVVSGGTPCYRLDYVLRLKATNYKKNNINLAIACLKKANEISFNTNYTCEKDYMRVVEYLKAVGRFDEARQEETKIKTVYLPTQFTETMPSANIEESYDSDIVESSADTFVCAECAKYIKRRFSKYGKNPKYPILPKYFKEDSPEHKHCFITFYPVIEGTSTAWDCPGDVVEYSNRPFNDERTEEQKRFFENEVAKRERAEIVRAEYDWLCEFLPDLAPKSLSGYSRMKNIKSVKYVEIFSAAQEKGKTLID